MKRLTTPHLFRVSALAGWLNCEQQQVLESLREENRVLHEQVLLQSRVDDLVVSDCAAVRCIKFRGPCHRRQVHGPKARHRSSVVERRLRCLPNLCGGDVTRQRFYRSRLGRSRRYRRSKYGVTFGSGTGQPYSRIQSSRSRFDIVAAMSVDVMAKSSISRVTGFLWDTVDRWLEKAVAAAREFNDVQTRGVKLGEHNPMNRGRGAGRRPTSPGS